jgi:hypothetical protein
MWALDCARFTLNEFENKYPNELRPKTCLQLCEEWRKGNIIMPIAKKAILDCHKVSKEIYDIEYGSLCHAIGHAGATIHVKTHAIGLPMYELTSIVLKCNKINYSKPVLDKIKYYYDKLIYWEKNIDKINIEWASFL